MDALIWIYFLFYFGEDKVAMEECLELVRTGIGKKGRKQENQEGERRMEEEEEEEDFGE